MNTNFQHIDIISNPLYVYKMTKEEIENLTPDKLCCIMVKAPQLFYWCEHNCKEQLLKISNQDVKELVSYHPELRLKFERVRKTNFSVN